MSDTEMEMLIVPIESLHPNPWNPNVMNEQTYRATKESLRLYGQAATIACRPHPDIEGEWQILDGEHRWQAAKEEGLTRIGIVPLRRLTEVEAKKLTLVMNEVHGENDLVPMAQLLKQIEQETGIENLLMALPFKRGDMEEMLQIANTDWDQFSADRAVEVERFLRGRASQATLREAVLHFTDEQHEQYQRFASMLMREWATETVEQTVLRAMKESAERL